MRRPWHSPPVKPAWPTSPCSCRGLLAAALVGSFWLGSAHGAGAASAPPADSAPALPRWVARHYGPADGLPVSSATSGRIDADGFLWLATHDGLARFDGQRFDVHESMRFPAMSGNRVLSLHLDPQQRLYAHTAHGDWLQVRSGRIEPATLPGSAGGQSSPPPQVRHVDAASLCLTTARALHCPDGDGAFPARWHFPGHLDAALALPGGEGKAWLVTRQRSIWHFRDAAWQQLHDAGQDPGGQAPRYAVGSSDGSLWTEAGGRLLQVDSAGTVRRWDNGDGDRRFPAGILQLRLDADGQVVVGATNGVFRIRDGQPQLLLADAGLGGAFRSWDAPDGALWVAQGGRLWRLPPLAGGGKAKGLPPRTLPPEPVLTAAGDIQDLLPTRQGDAWAMTLRDGIHHLTRARVELLDDIAGVRGGNVYGVSHAPDGTMWLGTLDSGLLAIAADGSARRFGTESGLPGDNPWLVAATADGGLHVGTYAPGLWYRAPGEARFQPMDLPAGLRGEQILAVATDQRQRLWLGSSAGAWRRDGQDWRRLWPDGGRKVRVGALALSGNTAWYGSAEGVWRQEGGTGHAVAAALLARTSVRDLYLAGDGALWISTDGRGLVRVAADDPAGERALQLGRAQGLPSNSPHAVREDGHGHLWVNSNQGIFRISRASLADLLADTAAGRRPARLSPLVLGLADGLTELEGNGGVQPAAAIDAAGRLWFPSQRGVVRFDPLAIELRDQAPRPIVDSLEHDGQRLAVAPGGDLPAGVRNVLVRFGAADLNAGGLLRFRHRLLPLEQGWTDALNGRSAAFSGLAPGDYRFELLVGNSDGIWSAQPGALAFRVPPAWHETPAFRAGVVAAGLLLLVALVRLRLSRLRMRALQLDRVVQQRTRELDGEKGRLEAALSELAQTHAELARTHHEIEDSNLRLAAQAQRLEALDRFRSRLLADVSHELRTPVMLVALPLQELHGQAGQLGASERKRLALALKQLERLRSLVEQLVGLVQAESGQMTLRLQRLDLVATLRDIVAGYEPMARRQGIDLELHGDSAPLPLYAERGHLATVFGNLIDNALRHAPAGSAVQVVVQRGQEQALVTVHDQGPGFGPDLAGHLFERFYRGNGPPRQGREGLGIGLALARELVELHGGRISASSTPGAGASFRVELPLGSAHVALDDLDLAGDPAPVRPLPARTLQAGSGGDGADGRVLLVEDHPDLAAYLAERLGEHLPVTCVGDAGAALAELAADDSIRLLISDVVLPGRSGIELCRRLAVPQAADADGATGAAGEPAPPRTVVPVILISARAGSGDRQAGLDAGAVAWLAKPFSFETLLDHIGQAWPAARARLVAPPADPGQADPVLAIALRHLCRAEFSVTEWAGHAHLSERQLRRRVKELTGQPPQTWLREQRLQQVRRLLGSGACKTLAEAGSRCGFDNPAWLYRCFRARFGNS